MSSYAFLYPSLPFLRPSNSKTSSLTSHPSPRNARPSHPSMIQRPDADGPPDLEAFFDAQQRSVGTVGAPVTLATARALLSQYPSAADAALAALKTASDSLTTPPQLCHITVSLDVDAAAISNAISSQMPSVPILGRSVNKKDSQGTIEILLLRSDSPGGIATSSVSVPVEETLGSDAISSAAKQAAQTAANNAIAALDPSDPCTFLVFSTSPGADVKDVRNALDSAYGGIVAYGGPAVGASDTGLGWSLIGGDGTGVQNEDVASVQTAHVAAVPGSLPFLFSAVIKTWVQPAYTEPLSYMTPTYIDDAQIDLLTAIRYNDWEKFLWCIEEQGIDVNTKWVNKQNQSPLLAASGRARTEMIKYLIDHGADVQHRNDGGFTAAMYTRMLTGYDESMVSNQLKMLEDGGLNTKLSEEETERLKKATGGRIVE